MSGMSGMLGIPGITLTFGIQPKSSATSVAFLVSLPRRYSICTVSPGSSLRASCTRLVPGPDSSSSSALSSASAVPLNLVMMSPTLSPAFAAGPPWRDALDLRAELVRLGVGLGLHDDSDPAAVVVSQDDNARRARRAPRTLCGETRRPGGEHGRRDHDPGALHDQMLLRGFTAPCKPRA